MLWTIIIILLAFWLIGVVIDIAGGLIHLLLIAAIIFLVVRLFRRSGRPRD